MNKKVLVGFLIVLLTGMFLTYAAPGPNIAQADEDLLAVGIVTYGLAHLYEGLHDWGFMPVPGLTGSRSANGSFSYTFKAVDPDGDGQFILNGSNKATLSKDKINEILDITIHDSDGMNYKVYITATGSPDEDLVMTSMKINGRAFTQSQLETLLEEDEDF